MGEGGGNMEENKGKRGDKICGRYEGGRKMRMGQNYRSLMENLFKGDGGIFSKYLKNIQYTPCLK